MILAIASKVERNQSLKKSKIKVKDFKKSKIEEVKDLKFGDSTRVYDSSRVSGATDEGMPFRYSRIIIPGPAHDGSGQVQGLED
jgi:hypothetical protein